MKNKNKFILFIITFLILMTSITSMDAFAIVGGTRTVSEDFVDLPNGKSIWHWISNGTDTIYLYETASKDVKIYNLGRRNEI